MLNKIQLELFKSIPGWEKYKDVYSNIKSQKNPDQNLKNVMQEYIKIAEKLAENHGGDFPLQAFTKDSIEFYYPPPPPLYQNIEKTPELVSACSDLLFYFVKNYPEKFKHIRNLIESCVEIDNYPVLAQQILDNHFGVFPKETDKTINQNLIKYMNCNPAAFKHIRRKKSYTLEDWLKVGKKIYHDFGDTLPNFIWFKSKGLTSFFYFFNKYRELFPPFAFKYVKNTKTPII